MASKHLNDKIYGYGQRDIERIQRAVRTVEDQFHRLKSFRRVRGTPKGGGGQAVVWAIVKEIPDYNDPAKNKFKVEKASVDADPQSQTYNQWIGDGTPIYIERALNFEGFLDGVNDDAKDIRNWAPWPNVNSIVPIIQKWDYHQTTPGLRWFLDIDMFYTGAPEIASIRFNPRYYTSGSNYQSITQAVWI